MKSVLPFLKELTENNNREWFNEHKKQYVQVQSEFEQLLSQVIIGVQTFDKGIGILQPKDCVFRIYRDVRFSHDKQPYKTNIGGFIARNGRKSIYSGYYIHIDPEGCFLGGGIYLPEPDILQLIRNEIYFNSDEMLSILNEPKFVKYFGEISDENKLKKPPKGFDPDFKHIDLLKFRNYTVINSFDADRITSDGFIKEVLDKFNAMYPLSQFLNRAIDNREH
ncbi:MAG: DUF2461 domain-containing protein [Bacteroidota bacterium]